MRPSRPRRLLTPTPSVLGAARARPSLAGIFQPPGRARPVGAAEPFAAGHRVSVWRPVSNSSAVEPRSGAARAGDDGGPLHGVVALRERRLGALGTGVGGLRLGAAAGGAP